MAADPVPKLEQGTSKPFPHRGQVIAIGSSSLPLYPVAGGAPLGIPDLMAAHWSLWPLLSLIALGAFGTAIANVLMASAAGHFGAARASATTFLIPVVALVLAVVLLHEQVALLSVAGGLVCLAGAWLMKRASSH